MGVAIAILLLVVVSLPLWFKNKDKPQNPQGFDNGYEDDNHIHY